MNDQSTDSDFVVQSNLQRASSLVLDLLLPHKNVALICADLQYKYRNRIYNPMVTVWLFITQVISADHSCQQTLTRFNAWRVAKGLRRVSSATKAYCTARSKLPEQLFARVLEWTSQQCEEATNSAWLFKGRVVDMVDGWTVTMADTPENQKEYPQQKSQKPGCGFPIARMIGLFSLPTGAIQFNALAPYQGKQTGETSLLRTVLDRISRGRILLADRYYATFWLLALGETRGIDLVARAHQLRKIDFRKGLKLGYLDQLVVYHKPQRPAWMDQDEYDELPNLIFVRHVKYKVHQKGFRSREIVLATTLLDAELYTAEELAELYRKRWQVELHIRSLKTQMQMEHLRCKSPQMVRKEIHCHMIGFNLVRAAMLASALKHGLCPTTLSFKGAMQALEEFAACLRLRSGRSVQQWDNLLETISELSVGDRPGRKEERVIKRRPKNYKLMKTPRNPNRNRYATAA
ncbi:IS4 family transposase [Roseimaritima ulvae]|uniref:Transposase DDE domain protein n=1 Tax=Roseimaritima ulvae TaxID=980254 RepID=A0A5B9R903_9BACT|nr:IS4 family transposase [Roseimaritima ulvae]QEG41239.1 Transposase DDE domain protein [Roseimaritima ulvae]QEG41600.1 Transposase DDE domain protein [Roseimaritima ulvae]QEG43203.1 Transposase DDE domain protein [Roseimaritima ulvae]